MLITWLFNFKLSFLSMFVQIHTYSSYIYLSYVCRCTCTYVSSCCATQSPQSNKSREKKFTKIYNNNQLKTHQIAQRQNSQSTERESRWLSHSWTWTWVGLGVTPTHQRSKMTCAAGVEVVVERALGSQNAKHLATRRGDLMLALFKTAERKR